MKTEDHWEKILESIAPWEGIRSSDCLLWENVFPLSPHQIFKNFRNLSVQECKLKLAEIESTISKQESPNDLRRNFYLSFIEQMALTRTVHYGLSNCEKLIETKVLSFLEREKIKGDFPSLSSDEGIIPVLIFVGKFIPLETYHAEVTVISKFLFFKLGIVDKIRFVCYVLFRMGGLKPVLAYHLPKSNDKKFTVDCLARDNEITSDIFFSNKFLKGTIQASWFLDPVLKELSPHLYEIRSCAEKNGAFIASLGENVDAAKDAILKSGTRRRLYMEGKYKPKKFLRLWSRKDILSSR